MKLQVTAMILVIPLLSVSVAAQNKPQKPETTTAEDTKGEKVNVFVQTWDGAEIKNCQTYLNEPYLLLCDHDGFLKQLGDATEELVLSGKSKKMTDEERRANAFESACRYAVTHSKTFHVRFSKPAWPKEPSKERKLSLWDCTKDASSISCE
jgi:hypothetical protein